MLKMTEPTDKLASGRNNNSKSASSKNNNSRSASGKNDNNGETDEFSVGGNNVEHSKKSGKWKGQKLAKSKKLLKSGDSFDFGTIKAGPSFLTLDTRTAFDYLWLTFTKAPIFWYFNLEYHI